MKVVIILSDSGHDSKECFNEITKMGTIIGIPVRKNASTLSRRSPKIEGKQLLNKEKISNHRKKK